MTKSKIRLTPAQQYLCKELCAGRRVVEGFADDKTVYFLHDPATMKYKGKVRKATLAALSRHGLVTRHMFYGGPYWTANGKTRPWSYISDVLAWQQEPETPCCQCGAVPTLDMIVDQYYEEIETHHLCKECIDEVFLHLGE